LRIIDRSPLVLVAVAVIIIILAIAIKAEVQGPHVAANHSNQPNTAKRSDPSLPEVSLQLLLLDSNGKVVTYLEPTEMYISNIKMVHQYLNAVQNRTIITKDGKNFELLKFELDRKFDTTEQISTHGLVYQNDFQLFFRHNGYISQPGDTRIAYWNILRTVT
jgi:hypothetical protein